MIRKISGMLLFLLLWVSNTMESVTYIKNDFVQITKPDAKNNMIAIVIERSVGNQHVFARIINRGPFQNTVHELQRGEFRRIETFTPNTTIHLKISEQQNVWPRTTYVEPTTGEYKDKLCQVETVHYNGKMTIKLVGGSTYQTTRAYFDKLRYVSDTIANSMLLNQRQQANKTKTAQRPRASASSSNPLHSSAASGYNDIFGSYFNSNDSFSSIFNDTESRSNNRRGNSGFSDLFDDNDDFDNNYGFGSMFNYGNPNRNRTTANRNNATASNRNNRTTANRNNATASNHRTQHNRSSKLPDDLHPGAELCYDQIINKEFALELASPLELLGNKDSVEIYVSPQLSTDLRPLYNNMFYAFTEEEIDGYYQRNMKFNIYTKQPFPPHKNQLWKRKLVNKKFFNDFVGAVETKCSIVNGQIQELKYQLENEQENNAQEIIDEILTKYSEITEYLAIDILDSIRSRTNISQDDQNKELIKYFKSILSKIREAKNGFQNSVAVVDLQIIKDSRIIDTNESIDTDEIIKHKEDFSLKPMKIEPVVNEVVFTDEDTKSLAISMPESNEESNISDNSIKELDASNKNNQPSSNEELNFSNKNNRYSTNSNLLEY